MAYVLARKLMLSSAVLIFLLTLPALVSARQEAKRPPPPTAKPLPAQPGSIGPIGLPLTSIGLPLSPLGIQAVPSAADQQRRNAQAPTPDPYAPHYGQADRPMHRPYYGYAYVLPTYYGAGYSTPGTMPPAPVAPVVPSGTVRIDVQPEDIAQIYVDGQYVGTPRDLDGRLALEPGTRRLAIRAPGYETINVDVKVVADRTITYRGSLSRIATERELAPRSPPPSSTTPSVDAPAPPTAPAGSRTMYFVPGCYMGNVPPSELKLPKGCDLSKMQTFTP